MPDVAKKASSRKKAAAKKVRRISRSVAPGPAKAGSGKGKTRATAVSTRAPAKSPLPKEDLKAFRRMLLEKRRDLVGDLTGIQAGTLRVNRQEGSGDLSSMPTHPADLGTDNFEQEFTLGLLESERALLKEIDQALERIENGTYGVCAGTGKPIGKARLLAQPWAKYCIDYARMVEKGLVRAGSEERRSEEEEEEQEEVEGVEVAEEEEAEAKETPEPAAKEAEPEEAEAEEPEPPEAAEEEAP